jgi:LmbE family N-acetylglucosaminyl deacetylase
VINLSLDGSKLGGLRILCLGAHSDDIEIGCGGTMLRLLATLPEVHLGWVVLSAPGVREAEARGSAEAFSSGAASRSIQCFDFEESYFPWHGATIKRSIETLKAFEPDVVFTHARSDLHQDHRVTSELTWNTFRNHLVLEYEIPKYDGDLGSPNVFVPLTEEVCARKIALLKHHFGSQRSKHWFDEQLFSSLTRLRGMECCSPSRHAEAFYGRKVVL